MPRDFERYTGYEIAQMAQDLYDREGISPEEFLDLVYPGHRIKNPVNYLVNLASGRQKVGPLEKASRRDSGRTMTVFYKVADKVDPKTGEIISDDIRTAKINVPYGYSRLDMVSQGGSRLRNAVNKYFEKTYERRDRASKASSKDRIDRARARKKSAKQAARKAARQAGEVFDEEEWEEQWDEDEGGDEDRYTAIRNLGGNAELRGFATTVHAGAPVAFS